MADQPKKKPVASKTLNTERPNRKARKTSSDAIFGHKKEYRGSHTRRSPQTYLQKVLLGQGAFRGIEKPIAGSTDGRWKAPLSVSQPYDPAQVEVNKRLYPHLFADR